MSSGNFRNFWKGADVTALMPAWASSSSATRDEQMRMQGDALLARARDFAQNSPLAKSFLRSLAVNVVGSGQLRPRILVEDRRGRRNHEAASELERSFAKWCRKGSATVSGTLSYRALLAAACNSLAVDGDIFLRQHIRPGTQEPYLLEPIDNLMMPYSWSSDGPERVRSSIVVDDRRAPVAYLVNVSGRTTQLSRAGGRDVVRLPAEEVLHCFEPEYPTDVRGVSWFACSLFDAKMLEGLREAELVASRWTASKFVFFESEIGAAPYKLTGDSGDTYSGQTEALPPGVRANLLSPEFPNANISEFERRILKGATAGWGGSYHNVANDYGEQNYSGLRQAELNIRRIHEGRQALLVEDICDPVVWNWLAATWGVGPEDGIRVTHQLPTWPWVDPSKEANARATELQTHMKTLNQHYLESGLDPDDVWADLLDQELRLAELRRIANGGEK